MNHNINIIIMIMIMIIVIIILMMTKAKGQTDRVEEMEEEVDAKLSSILHSAWLAALQGEGYKKDAAAKAASYTYLIY